MLSLTSRLDRVVVVVVVIEIYDICGHYFKLEEGGLRGSTVGSPFLMEINGQSMGDSFFRGMLLASFHHCSVDHHQSVGRSVCLLPRHHGRFFILVSILFSIPIHFISFYSPFHSIPSALTEEEERRAVCTGSAEGQDNSCWWGGQNRAR